MGIKSRFFEEYILDLLALSNFLEEFPKQEGITSLSSSENSPNMILSGSHLIYADWNLHGSYSAFYNWGCALLNYKIEIFAMADWGLKSCLYAFILFILECDLVSKPFNQAEQVAWVGLGLEVCPLKNTGVILTGNSSLLL